MLKYLVVVCGLDTKKGFSINGYYEEKASDDAKCMYDPLHDGYTVKIIGQGFTQTVIDGILIKLKAIGTDKDAVKEWLHSIDERTYKFLHKELK